MATMFDSLREAALEASREVARRTALARQPRPAGVNGPPLKLLLGEIGALAGRVRPSDARPYRASKPGAIMLLPGFGAHPGRMRHMQEALNAAGHTAEHWGLGFNLGPTEANFRFLMRRVGAMAHRHGGPVALVGWSLGGLFAREIAHRQPNTVSRVITMGTPFSGDRRANNAWRAYQLITGHTVDEPPIDCAPCKPPVPTIALWSPRDGVIAPRCAAGWPGERDRAIAVRCNHLGFVNDPQCIAEVLRQLDAEFSRGV